MHSLHPPRRYATLLLATLLASPLASQVPASQRTTVRAQAPGNGNVIVVWPRHLQTLQARLDSFAVALPAEERALWNAVLLRAANAPTPAAGEVRVTPVLEIGPGGGCEDQPGMGGAANRVAIIVQGGRTAGASGIVVQGGRTATPATGIVVQGGRTASPTTGIVVQGGRTSAGARPATPTEAVATNPKLEPVPWLASESLGRRLAELSLRLSPEERGTLNWLLTRAAATDVGLPPGPCNPERGCRPADGLPPGAQAMDGWWGAPGHPGGGTRPHAQKLDGFWWPPLPKALGIEPLAIGPKQDDPRPPTPSSEQRWILRY
jgi:hypothetical protein